MDRSGVLLSLAGKIVHVILPLADEYQTTKTIEKANQFLAKKSKILGDKISSAQVIQNILQAELYRLDDYLDESPPTSIGICRIGAKRKGTWYALHWSCVLHNGGI
jgi:hypothetical protein